MPIASDPISTQRDQIKAKLTEHIVTVIRKRKWKQADAARHLGLSTPRISNLVNGQLEKFSIDMLITLSLQLGHVADIKLDQDSEKLPFVMTLHKA